MNITLPFPGAYAIPVQEERKRVVVGIADAACVKDSGVLIVTHSLGSCLGVSIFDPKAGVGGLLHALLPLASQHPEKTLESPYACVDAGFARLCSEYEKLGGRKERMILKVAGGGSMIMGDGVDHFEIGKRNMGVLRKTLWSMGILIAASHVGGSRPTTMVLDMANGQTRIVIDGVTRIL